MITLTWTIERAGIDFGSYSMSDIVEVSAAGESIVERIHEMQIKRLYKIGPKDGIVLGHFERNGSFFGEWAFDLDIDEKWLRDLMPASVKREAFGNVSW
jgi:hypothetical protein